MSETEVISIIEEEISKTSKGFKTEVIKREFDRFSEYIATVAVIFKENSVTPQMLNDITERLKNDGNTDIELSSSEKDLGNLDYEILIFKANITIGD